MLTVTIEIWGGGSPLRRRVIGILSLANVSDLAEESDYEGYLDGEPIEVKGHNRADGAWKLIQKALNENLEEDG